MFRSFTLAQQIAAGVLLPFMFILLTLTPYSYLLNVNTYESNQRVAHAQAVLFSASELMSAASAAEAEARAYALTGRDDTLLNFRALTELSTKRLEELGRIFDNAHEQSRLPTLSQALREVQRESSELIELRRSQGLPAAAQLLSNARGSHPLEELRKLGENLRRTETEQLQQHTAEFDASSKRGILLPLLCIPTCLGVMIGAVVLIIRRLYRQIGSTIAHLRSSATELQAAATQQAKGSKGQAATATEVATTMRELVSTSRQIADSAQRVTGISTETTTAARAGDHTMQSAQTAIQQIKHQVDRIVTHMLDLGKRSQEIGGILDIINELAEQTNILAINATIEAAGAGEQGRRFAVVADEIRKLADRVGGSTKEIRSLIEEVRAAANTSVMVTEDGSKAVDSSARQFIEVAASFRRIVELVGNTSQASREIELSTKQQTTAVEQVSTAMTEVAQTARETESSSNQTMQTAAQLVNLSQDLVKLVRRNTQA